MARWYSFSIARFAAHPARDERLNVGLIVFDDDRLDIRPARNLDKIRAISAALEAQDLRAAMLRLEHLDQISRGNGITAASDRRDALAIIGAFEFSALSRFEAHSPQAYEQAVSALLSKLVEPEPAPLQKRGRRSKVLSSLKFALREEGVLARRGEDLSAHRVVSGWPLAEGLSADLVLKNGAMHVIETVDAQSDDVSRRKLIGDIGVAALVLEQARMTFGETQTKARLVYSASSANEESARPSLRAAEHQGAELVNWASADDRRRLIADIVKLAVPIETRKGQLTSVNSSTLSKLSLN